MDNKPTPDNPHVSIKDEASAQDELDRRTFLSRLAALGATAAVSSSYTSSQASSLAPDRADILIRGAYVITMDNQRRVFTNGYVAIKDGKIAGVGQDKDCNFEAKDTISGSGFLVMPGLVNGHNHLVQVNGRGQGGEAPPPAAQRRPPADEDAPGRMDAMVRGRYLESIHWTEERTYNIVRAHLLDMLKGGTIATHDQQFSNYNKNSIDGTLRAIHDSGMRAFVARALVNSPDILPEEAREDADSCLKEVERLRKRWNSSRIEVVPSPTGVSYVRSADDIVALHKGAKAMGSRFEMELAGNDGPATMKKIGWKGGVIEWLDSLGVLDDKLLGDKGHLLQDQEYKLWKDRGIRVCMVPMLRIGDGTGLPADKFVDLGILPGIGTDGMVTPCSGMWPAMRYVLQAQRLRDQRLKIRRPEGAWGYPELMLEMATRGGAWALFMDDRTGSLEVGKEGDCILINTRRPYLSPHVNGTRLVTSLVTYGESDMVDTVIVAGKVLVRNRKCVVWDEEEVVNTAEKTLAAIQKDVGRQPSFRTPGTTVRGWTYL